MKPLLWALLATGLLAACHKPEIPDDVTESPVFSVAFESDSVGQTLTAGLDGRYLFTSFDRDGFDVVTMKGAFAASDCPNADCPGTLTFEFRNVGPGAVVELDSGVIAPGNLVYKQAPGDTTTIAQMTFSLDNPNPGGSYFWTLYQQSQLQAEADSPSLTRSFINFEPLEIHLDYSSGNGFFSSTVRSYFFNQTECPGVYVVAKPDSSLPGSHNYILSAKVTPGSGPIQYLWSNGSIDSTFVADSTVLFTPYAVTVTNSNGCTASVFASNVGAGDVTNQSPQIVLTRQDSVILGDELQLGRVALQWIQPDGQVFRSDLGEQPVDSYFQVLHSAFYEPNEKGEKTSWMQVAFRCWLFNSEGVSRPFEGSGTIGIAYP